MVFDNSVGRRGLLALAFSASFSHLAKAKRSPRTRAQHYVEAKTDPKPQIAISAAQDEQFRHTIGIVSNASELWLQTMQATARHVPAYIDMRLAVMYAILETSLTERRHGLIQLAPNKQSAFWEVKDDLIEYLNRDSVRVHIGALKNTDTKVTEGNLLRYFNDPNVQFAAMNFNALRDSQDLEGSSSLKHLPNDLKRACLYVGYNHRQIFDAILSNPTTKRPIAALTPQLIGFLLKNERIYGKGGSNSPIKILRQIPEVSQPLLNTYAPILHAPSTATPVPKRPVKHHASHASVKKHGQR